MSALKRVIICVGATLGAFTSAYATGGCPVRTYASDPDVLTTLVAQQPSVTLSTPVQTTSATYRVSVNHYVIRDEELKPVRVLLKTQVIGATSPQNASIVATSVVAIVGAPAVTFSCHVPAPTTSVVCTISQLVNGAPPGPPADSVTFDVRVQAPTDGAKIKLTADTSWDEDYDNNTCTETEPQRGVETLLEAPQANKAASFVPPAGSLFTVNTECTRVPGVIGCAATRSDPWTTTITVKQGANLAEIAEDVNAQDCPRAGNLLDCRSSDVSVPAYASGLVIFLRRDESTIRGGNIKHGIVYYTATTPAPNVVYPLQVPACTDTTYGPLPKAGIPCINYVATPNRPYVTTEYKKKTVPNHPVVPPEFGRDWEFVIYAIDNGKYNN